MIRYINQNKKKLVGRNNQINTSPLVLDYSCIEKLKFQFINDINQIQDISNISGLYFAGSLKMGEPSSGLIFLSQDYTVENNIPCLRRTDNVPFMYDLCGSTSGVNGTPFYTMLEGPMVAYD